MPLEEFSSASGTSHRLTLEDRRRLTVQGVGDVERFDETQLILHTDGGRLIVTGRELHIGALSVDGGELSVEGRVDSLTYEDPVEDSRGLLGRLFR